MSKLINELLQKELTRKQFLGVIGAGLVSALGLSTVLPSLTEVINVSPKGNTGYGRGVYVTAKRNRK